MQSKKLLLKFSLLFSVPIFAQEEATFDQKLNASESYNDGKTSNSQPFTDGDFKFDNSYSTYWSKGFAISNITDNQTEGYLNMYSAVAGHGALKTTTYAIGNGYSAAGVKLQNKSASVLSGLYVTNSTYAYYSMKKGDSFAKKFGGSTGNDADYFILNIKGFLNGTVKENEIDFYLADFRFQDNTKDYIVNTWKWVDLSSLGSVDSISFSLNSSDTGEWGMNTPAFFCIDNINMPYFADVVGSASSNAIHKDSSIIKTWANSATITRGYKDINVKESGLTSVGTEESCYGIADGNVLSLGDSGSVVVSFQNYVINGTGPDFCIFENSFNNTYLELATVAVSSDGEKFVQFPAISNTSDTAQVGSFGSVNTKLIHNLAGKYKANYGTPFDLEELADSTGLDINQIKYIKITDVVGNIKKYSTFDINNNPINDPWNTPYTSSGFDLDAVGVLNEGGIISSITDLTTSNTVELFPNPAKNHIKISNYDGLISIYNTTGEILASKNINNNESIDISNLEKGIYLIKTNISTLKFSKE